MLPIEYYSTLPHGIFYSPLLGDSQYSDWVSGSMTEGRGSIPSGATYFSFPKSTLARGVSSVLRSGYREPFPRGKSAGREADRLQTSRAEVKN